MQRMSLDLLYFESRALATFINIFWTLNILRKKSDFCFWSKRFIAFLEPLDFWPEKCIKISEKAKICRK